jgi:hypothetical protein
MNTTHTEKNKPARRPSRRMSVEQLREKINKKMRALELMQAAMEIEEHAVSCIHCEYERMQEYMLSMADRQLFARLVEYGARFPRLEELRGHAQEIAKKYLPQGLPWDWKWYLRELVKDAALPPVFATMYNLEEKEMLGR